MSRLLNPSKKPFLITENSIRKRKITARKPFSNTNKSLLNGSHYGYSGRPITESVLNGLFTLDGQWKVRYWNKAAEKLLGVPARDILGKDLRKEFAEIMPKGFSKFYRKAFLQDIPVHFEKYWREKKTWFDTIAFHCEDILYVSFK